MGAAASIPASRTSLPATRRAYLRTMDVKPFYRQLLEGGKLSVCSEKTAAPCSWDDDNMPHFQPGFMVRVSGDVRLLTREEVTEKAAANPQSNVAIYDINKYPETRVLVLHSAWGELYDYDFNMVHRDHKILRERFAWGGATSRRQGFPSLMRASSAVPAPMPALTRLSCPAAPTLSWASAATSAATATTSARWRCHQQGRFERLGGSHGKRTRRAQRNRSRPFRAHHTPRASKTSRTCPLTATSSALSAARSAQPIVTWWSSWPAKDSPASCPPTATSSCSCSPTTRCPWLLWLKPSGKIHPR